MAARKARDPHPEEELGRLAQALKEGLPPAVLLRGEERFFADRAIRGLLGAAHQAGLEVCRHDTKDPEFSLPTLLDDLSGGALFASARCIIVLNVEGIANKTGPKSSPAFLSATQQRIAAGTGDVVVLGASSLRADHVLAKAVKAAGGLMLSCRKLWETPPPWDPDPRKAELVLWLVARARSRKLSLSPDQAAYVVAATGNDLPALDEQLTRIEAKGGDVRGAVGWENSGSPYPIADEIVSGNAARAVSGIETLFLAGFSGKDGTKTLDRAALVNMLLMALSSKVREALGTSDALAAGAPPEQAATQGGFRGAPSMRQAFLARAQLRSPAEWRARLSELAELERRARSGASVDASDLAALALRWRVQAPAGRSARRR